MSWARSSTGLGTGDGTPAPTAGSRHCAPMDAGGAAALPKSLLRRAFARSSVLRRMDWVLLATVLALSLIGTLLVWSATSATLREQGSDPRTYLLKQLLNIVIGLVLMLGVERRWTTASCALYAPVLYGVSLLGLLAVLTPLGTPVNGSKSWITLPGGYQIEPSEFAKLSIILMAATFLSEMRDADGRPSTACRAS